MTTSTSVPDPGDKSPGGTTGWRRPRRAVLVSVVALLLVVPASGWFVASAATADRVLVEVTVERCAFATFQHRRGLDEARPNARRRVLVVEPRTRCSLGVKVTNSGTFPVRLERGVAPYVGPGAGDVVEGEVLVGGQPDATMDPDAIDASVRLDRSLAAGESTRFRIVLTTRDLGCSSGVTAFGGWPRVDLSALGRDLTAESGYNLAFAWKSGQNPGCQDT